MSDEEARQDQPNDLRRQAEEKAREGAAKMPENLGALSPEQHERLLHELRVHQIELEMQNDELRRAQAIARIGSWSWDVVADKVQWSDEMYRIYGIDRDAFGGTVEHVARLIHADDRSRHEQAVWAVRAGRSVDSFDYRVVRPDGTERTVEVAGIQVEAGADGRARRMVGVAQDVTERRRAEEALKESEARYRDLVENASDLICTHDLNGVLLSVNATAARALGFAAEEIVGRSLRNLLPGDRQNELDAYLEAIVRDGVAAGTLKVVIRPGDVRYWEYRNSLRTGGAGAPVVRGVARDVTEQVLAKRALKRSEEKHRTILETIEESYYEVDTAGNFTFFNDSLCRLLGYSRDELTGMNDRQYTDAENAKKLYQAFNAVYRTGEPTRGFDWEIIRKDGTRRIIEASVSLRNDAAGKPIGFRGIIRDISERKRAEEALRGSEHRQRLVLEHLPVGVWFSDQTGTILEGNEAGRRIWAGARYVGIPQYGEYKGWWADTGKPIAAEEWALARAVRLGETSLNEEINIECFDGSRKTIYNSAVPIRDESGSIVGALVVNEDITDRKRAEAALAQSRAQLLQAQKMEAVGRLAGGVAHDFNNILQAMLSLATVLRIKAGSPELTRIVAEVEALIKRGAGLTQQLLLFSRRQVAEKKRVDLGELAGTVGMLLRRLIPENIRLTVGTTPERLWVDGDAGQLQQVIMNLVVNAKDAMPSGGTLTVRTRRVGGEAVLEVIDTGHGMDEETRVHLFEPFFTTKGVGTGLGLSVVHGIAEQHGGRVEVESVPGEGSVFRVILPAMPAPDEVAEEPSDETEVPRGNGERVLIVEDEDGARQGLTELLTILGYAVTAVGSGEEAGVLPAEPAPDLLLTDLMLPGIDGAALAAGLRDRWPGLRVVLMSGYTGDEAIRRGVNEGDVRFLQKPFDMAAVARALRAALKNEREAASSGNPR